MEYIKATDLHCRENIEKDIKGGFVGVLRVNGAVVGGIHDCGKVKRRAFDQ